MHGNFDSPKKNHALFGLLSYNDLLVSPLEKALFVTQKTSVWAGITKWDPFWANIQLDAKVAGNLSFPKNLCMKFGLVSYC